MIPTTATNTSTTQTAPSAMIGVVSLILEGRAVSEDEFALPATSLKTSTELRSQSATDDGLDRKDILTANNVSHTNRNSHQPQCVNITVNPNASMMSPSLMCRSSTSASLIPDITHQRWSEKLCQLQQSSPTISHETHEMVVVGAEDEKSDPDRRANLLYHRSPISEKLHTLQSLATTCLKSSPESSTSYGYSLLTSPPTAPFPPLVTAPKYTSLSSSSRFSMAYNLTSSTMPLMSINNNFCGGYSDINNGHSMYLPSSSSTKKHQPKHLRKGNGIGNNSCNTSPKHGPHCEQFLRKMGLTKGETVDPEDHICDITYGINVCIRWRAYCQEIEGIMARGEPICIEVYLGPTGHKILLEQWIITQKEKAITPTMTLPSLCSAIRSQLYFSQISAWCDLIKKADRAIFDTGRILFPNSTGSTQPQPHLNIFYRIKSYDSTASFNSKPHVHNFPNVIISENTCISVCLKSLPRITGGIPRVSECSSTTIVTTLPATAVPNNGALYNVTQMGLPITTESPRTVRPPFNPVPSTSKQSLNDHNISGDTASYKFTDDDGGCSSDATLSHREKQLIKYKKRILKRDKKSCKKPLSDNWEDIRKMQQIDQQKNLHKPPRIRYQPMQLDDRVSGIFDETFSDGPQQTMPGYGSINAIRPPLYYTTPTNNISESVQTQTVQMISTGTQTANFPYSDMYPNCDLCGSEMSVVCLNCDENFLESAPRNKADLLLQAIQRTPKTAQNRKPLRNNNNSPVMADQLLRTMSDCQVCKRQKTQHNFRPKHEEVPLQSVSRNSISTNGNGKWSPCKCEVNSCQMDEDEPHHYCEEKVNSNTTAIKENSIPPFTVNGIQNSDHQVQFKTPSSQMKTSFNNTLITAQPNIRPNLKHIFNGAEKKRVLPKINLTQIFCANSTTSPIPISCPSLDNTFRFDKTNEVTSNPDSPETVLPVQKSYSAPTLPNSSSLSPRFAKQAAFYKRRSRHLSDRSDRSSLGSDEQFSDEELENNIFSPASSPMRNRARALQFGRKPLLGNLEESLLQRRFVPKAEAAGFKVLLGASGTFCPTQLTIPASAYFYELRGESISTPYVCEIRLPRKGYLIPNTGTVQATLLNPMGTVVRMFVIPYDFRDMPPLHQTFIRQRVLAEESGSSGRGQSQEGLPRQGFRKSTNEKLGHLISSDHIKRLRYSIHLRFQTSRSGRLMLHTDIRFLISRRTDCDTAAAHAKGVLEAPNDLTTDIVMPNYPKYSARQDNPNKI